MKKIDFFLTYELKARELEYLTLLKYELERRGYRVVLDAANKFGGGGTYYDAEVAVCGGLDGYAVNFGNGARFRKAIELTTEEMKDIVWWEKAPEREKIGKEILVNAWGEDFKEKIHRYKGMPLDKIVVLGHPVMDLCKPRFLNYYYSKEELAEKYQLDATKTWNLFVSTFGYEAIGRERSIELDRTRGMDRYLRLYELEVKSKSVIFQWLLSLLEEDESQMIIYRPHPDEKISETLRELERRNNRFRVVRGESVRQWIRSCKRSYTWISSSIAEAFFMKKQMFMLHPYPVDADLDQVMFNRPGCFVSDHDTFRRTFEGKMPDEEVFPFDDEIYHYFRFSEQEYTYELLADLCEEVYRDDKYLIPEEDRRKLRENEKKRWREAGAKVWFIQWMRRRTWLYHLYHDHFSKDVDDMNLRPGEMEEIERRIARCIADG